MKGICTLTTWGPGFLGLFSQCIISVSLLFILLFLVHHTVS